MLVDLVLGSMAQAMVAELATTRDMRPSTAAVAVERPKFCLDAVARRAIKRA
jgi:hypothetical protein